MYKVKKSPKILFMAGQNRVSDWVLDFLKEEDVAVFRKKATLEDVRHVSPDLIITCYWPFLLSPEIINIPSCGCINFHPSLLPYNRGWYPSVWSILDGSPAGVTLHLIDEGADTGPIIAQKEIVVSETDTGGSLYERSQKEIFALFTELWPKIFDGIELMKQGEGIYHTKKEANEIDEIYLDKTYTGRELIQLLKAKTFGDRGYAYYIKDDIKYNVKITVQ